MRLALVLMFRDFAGVAGLSLAAIYVKNVFHLNVGQAGLFVGIMTLPSVVFNPLAVYLTPLRRRLPGLRTILILGGLICATPAALAIGRRTDHPLAAFKRCSLPATPSATPPCSSGSPPNFAAESCGTIPPDRRHVRGLGPWVMGGWADRLAPHANLQSAYFGPFALVGACMILAAASPPLIARLVRCCLR